MEIRSRSQPHKVGHPLIFPPLNPTFSRPAFQCVLNSRHLPATRQHTVLSQHHAFKVCHDREVRTFLMIYPGFGPVPYHLALSWYRQLCICSSCSRYICTSPGSMQDHPQKGRQRSEKRDEGGYSFDISPSRTRPHSLHNTIPFNPIPAKH